MCECVEFADEGHGKAGQLCEVCYPQEPGDDALIRDQLYRPWPPPGAVEVEVKGWRNGGKPDMEYFMRIVEPNVDATVGRYLLVPLPDPKVAEVDELMFPGPRQEAEDAG